jgi:Uma2 family endonuclease
MASLATLAELLPGPGEWTEADYYPFSDRGRLVELSEGNIEVLPLPTHYHQLIVKRLFRAIDSVVERLQMGEVQFAPLPVRLWEGKIREPDLVYMSAAHADRIGKYWGVPDLAIEVVSEGGEITDKQIKRAEYARAGVLEYWIADLAAKTIELLTLNEQTGSYNPGTIFTTADMLVSPILPGFSLSLADLFATPSK